MNGRSRGQKGKNLCHEMKQIELKLEASAAAKPPLHKDYHKYMKRQHFHKVAPYSRTVEAEEAPPPKNRNMTKF